MGDGFTLDSDDAALDRAGIGARVGQLETHRREHTGGSPRGVVTDGTNRFSIPASGFAPYTRLETHQQLGATFKTKRGPGWNGSLVV